MIKAEHSTGIYTSLFKQTIDYYIFLKQPCILPAELISNKSSAVAEMGDRGHNRHGLKEGDAVPFRGALGTRLIQCGLCGGLLPYQVASSSIQPFGHNRHGSKTGGCAPFRGRGWVPI